MNGYCEGEQKEDQRDEGVHVCEITHKRNNLSNN